MPVSLKDTRLIMGMPVTVEVRDEHASSEALEKVFSHFVYVDGKFSTYKKDSEISQINRGELGLSAYSADMREVLDLCEKTKAETGGYFDIRRPDGQIDPSGVVKGWAIYNASLILKNESCTNFFIDAGGDIQASKRVEDEPWKVGIKNPFKEREVVKVLNIASEGVATSGSYIRGDHIYNPLNFKEGLNEVVSLTVVGPNVYEADRFATAAFAMGLNGINFIERLAGLEGYQINKEGIATMTSGFEKYISK